MIISISGAHGSGKSTLAKQLAGKLNWPHYYMGGLRREAAKKRGLSLGEYNKLGENDPKTDLEVDEYQHILGNTQDNFIIEGRTSWYFIPHSLKIYLDVNSDVSASRVFKDLENRPEESDASASLEDIRLILKERKASDVKRYRKYFNIEVYDRNNFDYYLDVSNLTIDETFESVWAFVSKHLTSDNIHYNIKQE